MSRQESLVRIGKTLLARRSELRQTLNEEINDLAQNSLAGSGDLADAAFDATGEEVATHVAEIEARELALVDIALMRIKQGKYGVCNACDANIPVARLDALPHSILCVKCQRESEIDQGWLEERMIADFNKVRDTGPEQEFTAAELEADLSR